MSERQRIATLALRVGSAIGAAVLFAATVTPGFARGIPNRRPAAVSLAVHRQDVPQRVQHWLFVHAGAPLTPRTQAHHPRSTSAVATHTPGAPASALPSPFLSLPPAQRAAAQEVAEQVTAFVQDVENIDLNAFGNTDFSDVASRAAAQQQQQQQAEGSEEVVAALLEIVDEVEAFVLAALDQAEAEALAEIDAARAQVVEALAQVDLGELEAVILDQIDQARALVQAAFADARAKVLAAFDAVRARISEELSDEDFGDALEDVLAELEQIQGEISQQLDALQGALDELLGGFAT